MERLTKNEKQKNEETDMERPRGDKGSNMFGYFNEKFSGKDFIEKIKYSY